MHTFAVAPTVPPYSRLKAKTEKKRAFTCAQYAEAKLQGNIGCSSLDTAILQKNTAVAILFYNTDLF